MRFSENLSPALSFAVANPRMASLGGASIPGCRQQPKSGSCGAEFAFAVVFEKINLTLVTFLRD